MNNPAFVTLKEAFLYCRDMGASLQERLEAFSEATRYLIPGYQEAVDRIAAIMPERQQYAASFKAEGEVQYPILTDIDNGYALSLNLAIWVGEEMQQILEATGRHVPDYQGNDAWVMPIPATFVIGQDGLVKARFIDPDYRNRMTIEDLLAAIKGAQT